MLQPPDTSAAQQTVERIRTSPLAWTITGVLILVAAYFLIRMIEWDLMNRQAENQEDPLDR